MGLIIAATYGCCGNVIRISKERAEERGVLRGRGYSELLKIEFDDPVMDVTKAVNGGNLRFKAVAGYTIRVPFVDNENHPKYQMMQNLKEKHGYEVINGTSDALTGEEHARLNRLAMYYSADYNYELLIHMGVENL